MGDALTLAAVASGAFSISVLLMTYQAFAFLESSFIGGLRTTENRFALSHEECVVSSPFCSCVGQKPVA